MTTSSWSMSTSSGWPARSGQCSSPRTRGIGQWRRRSPCRSSLPCVTSYQSSLFGIRALLQPERLPLVVGQRKLPGALADRPDHPGETLHGLAPIGQHHGILTVWEHVGLQYPWLGGLLLVARRVGREAQAEHLL